MGTRADFYIKKDNKLTWLGSTAYDGYGVAEQYDEDNFSPNDKKKRTNNYLEFLIHNCKNESTYLELISEYLKQRKDATFPKDGWPWPWDNSKLTDECYVFDASKLLRMKTHDGDYDNHLTPCVFAPVHESFFDEEGEVIKSKNDIEFCVPDMSTIKNKAPLGSSRSGVMVIGLTGQQKPKR